MRHYHPSRAVLQLLLLAIIGLVLAPGGAAAAEPRDYAYLFLQGKVTAANGDQPVDGVTVRLTAGADSFEATTDQRGVFIFEKLPIATYRLQITTADGEVIHTLRRIEDPRRIRIRIKTHRGEGGTFRLEPRDGKVAVDVPDPPARWDRFWKEVAIIVGVGLLFAL
jgi:hypothetical protein